MGTAAYSRDNDQLGEELAVGSAFQIPARNLVDARSCRVLGNPGVVSNARRILCDWNRAACRSSVACHDGRSRRELGRNVSAAITVLLRDGVRQFFPVVDQAAMVGANVVA